MNDTEFRLLEHIVWQFRHIGEMYGRYRSIAVLRIAELPADEASKAWTTASFRMATLREDVLALDQRLFQLERLCAEFFPALRPDVDALGGECARLANGCHLAELELRYPLAFPVGAPAPIVADDLREAA